jgi:hypothetical protein
VGSFPQGVQLIPIADAAIHGDTAHAGISAQQFGLAGHLKGQLAGRDQHQGLRDWLERVDELEDGQQVRAGLATARARLDHHVAPREEVGDGLGLDRHQLGPTGPFRTRLQLFRQVNQASLRQVIHLPGTGRGLGRQRL